MINRNTILNELNDIGSFLGNYNPQNLYSVPHGYFEGLPTQILNRIKALEANDSKKEIEYLSPVLSVVSKEMPYTVPVGYFRNLDENILQRIREHADYRTSEEEIESISPLLSGLRNKNPYSIPVGYFENFKPGPEKKEAKVISITKRRWYRLAVAAVVIGIVAISALVLLKQNQPGVNDPQAWVKKNVSKKVSTEKIDEFVTLANEDEKMKAPEETDAAKQAEIKELMKDVSEKEIQDFLNDAVALESNDADALMN